MGDNANVINEQQELEHSKSKSKSGEHEDESQSANPTDAAPSIIDESVSRQEADMATHSSHVTADAERFRSHSNAKLYPGDGVEDSIDDALGNQKNPGTLGTDSHYHFDGTASSAIAENFDVHNVEQSSAQVPRTSASPCLTLLAFAVPSPTPSTLRRPTVRARSGSR